MTFDPVLQAIEILREGGLVALPTETVYGLAADAENELAVRQIFALKGRPATHPLIVHIGDSAQIGTWVKHFPPSAQRLAEHFWPGPLTLILEKSARAASSVTGGAATIALRIPSHPIARAILQGFGGGLAAPSANKFGKVSPSTAAHVQSEFGAEIDLIVDGGSCAIGVESSIVDVSGERPRLLRAGGVSREALSNILGEEIPYTPNAEVQAPGMLASHYAPSAGLMTVSTAQEVVAAVDQALRRGVRVAALGTGLPALPQHVGTFEVAGNTESFAHALYAVLRDIDAQQYGLIVALLPDPRGLGLAVRDRLQRAAMKTP